MNQTLRNPMATIVLLGALVACSSEAEGQTEEARAASAAVEQAASTAPADAGTPETADAEDAATDGASAPTPPDTAPQEEPPEEFHDPETPTEDVVPTEEPVAEETPTEQTAPEESAPEESAPEESAPEESAPEEAAPGEEEPAEEPADAPADEEPAGERERIADTSTTEDAEPVAAPEEVEEAAANGAALPDDAAYPGMVHLPAVQGQPVGMSEKTVKAFLKTIGFEIKKDDERAQFLWDHSFTLMGPSLEVSVPELWVGRYEVTNAQWARFMDEPFNTYFWTNESEGMTLGKIAAGKFGIDPDVNGAAFLRAWLYILGRNEEVLLPIFNTDGAADWDPRFAKADEIPIPVGTRIAIPEFIPPEYWKTDDAFGEIPDHELDRPMRHVTWDAARKFCRWAGLHLIREAEWERAARGSSGNLFAWGNNWDPLLCVFEGHNRAVKAVWDEYEKKQRAGEEAAEPAITGIDWFGGMRLRETPRPATVNSFADGATPDGLHHMTGNVAEWVFDRALRYPGSTSKFKFDNYACLAKGGAYDHHDYNMLAAERIWDAGRQLEPDVDTNNIGFRLAAYTIDGMDLTMEIAQFFDDAHPQSPAYWMPRPPGLSKKAKASDYAKYHGYIAERTAGQINRDLDAGAKNHVYVKGAAVGAAVIPVKGIPDLKAVKTIKDYAEDENEILTIGIFAATNNVAIQLEDAAGEALPAISMGMPEGDLPLHFWGQDPRFGTWVQSGALLVMEASPPPPEPKDDEEEVPEPVKGLRIAVYPTNPGTAGSYGAHVRPSNRIGYLPGVVEYEMVDMDEVEPEGHFADGAAVMTIVLPSLDKKKGTVKTNSKGVKIVVRMPVTFQ